ncbi:MAG: hypothetical protein LBN02_08590 [Oscillospiraceae bacterium]|jgi:hypothetical protein|nr:hypothetical protein [Oscillospiraceae bacterium]
MKRITSAVLVLVMSAILLSSTSCKKVPATPDQPPTVEQFPLTVIIPKTTLQVGEQVTVTASIVNNYGKPVDIAMGNRGDMPNFFFRAADDTSTVYEFAVLATFVFNAGKERTRTCTIPSDKPGEYLLDVYYEMTADGVQMSQKYEFAITIV